MPFTTDEILLAAWDTLAENPKASMTFPRGFWPDVARVAVEMALQDTLEPVLDFRPCRSGDVTINVRRGVKQGLPPRGEGKVVRAAPDPMDENPFNRF